MNAPRHHASLPAMLAVLAALLSFAASAEAAKNPPPGQPLAEYLARARASNNATPPTPGSLWSPDGRFTDLASDDKARRANDPIRIRIVEQTQSQAAGSVQTQRTAQSDSGIGSLLGLVGERSGLQNIFSPRSSRTLDGQAQSDSTSSLNTILAGYIVEVLPNGMLVIEGSRSVEMNNERQTVLVRGIVRPNDVAPDNSVFSTVMSNLEVELKGKGVISDGVRPPNKILRVILNILGF